MSDVCVSFDCEQRLAIAHSTIAALEANVAGKQQMIDDLAADLVKAQADNERLSAAISWALGEGDSDFKPREQGQGAYWWRIELRARAQTKGGNDGK